ncbi:acyl-CoA dehydratase activase [Marispirochaeta aestuarii]|uniref:acyl-CoA dehydratase activase n=1 Tax=Marispirochaeta aestuarii TaxID=1963862 RepID=UPI0029C6036E|nr:acyl-CoA dehydratase activase [Marispirochaeta aestuarii]
MSRSQVWAGIDVGSTTLKIALVDPETRELLHAVYRRHGAKQAACARELLAEAHALFPGADFNVAVCGSGGRIIAKAVNGHYIQEVVANSLAIREFFPRTRVAIELGGQDAKVVFFHHDENTGRLMASDMRMNGSCAGGTGAFIDEVASLLKITSTEFNSYAERGKTVYPISGRCGVFAKTDIQPLLNQGVSKEDIALSTFHAIAKQTIGGLAQGMEIVPPVIFEGGPLTFNPVLIRVFAERLGLKEHEIILPERPEVIVAYGTALSVGIMFGEDENRYQEIEAMKALARPQGEYADKRDFEAVPFFSSPEEKEKFHRRYPLTAFRSPAHPAGTELSVYLGIDAGSTTSKFVLLNEEEEVVYRFYSGNNGDPLTVVQQGLLDCYHHFEAQGVKLRVLGAGSTGYGEGLFAAAFKADYHTVETVAHAEAALHYQPEASFILDIGGQDMKAISLTGGIVTGIVLNEACSAGCGSFVETYANSLEIPVEEIAEKAFSSSAPAKLGSRCTIFMNSSIITEQKNGKTPEDIMAGLCKSIIENVFTKVIRVSNLDALGDSVVVQGGTFKNDAVLRAFEQYSGKRITRAPFPGEMGAIGIALLTKRQNLSGKSSFIGKEGLSDFSFTKEPGHICPFCSNNCSRTLVSFADGSSFITGNRCERGQIIGDVKDPGVREKLKAASHKLDTVPDMMRRRRELLFADYKPRELSPPKNYTIGLPRVLEFWHSMPFWRTLFTSLGFKVAVSRESTRKLYEAGLRYVPSDTACFPGKVAHGHLMDLIEKGVDRIFMPMMLRMESENKSAVSNYLCSVVQGYPLILKESHEPAILHGIPMDTPAFHWYDLRSRDRQLADYFASTYNIPRQVLKQAIAEADRAQGEFRQTLQNEGREIIRNSEEKGDFAVVLAGRPYHNDFLVNHDLSRFFTRHGIPVLTVDSLPGFNEVDLSGVRGETAINFHVRMFEAALIAAEHPALELVQIVSFGCGHDAVISDEIIRIMKAGGNKDPLVLKLDESDVPGPLNIRIKSFVETVRAKRVRTGKNTTTHKLPDPFPAKYTRGHRSEKTILVPNLSPTFTRLTAAVLRREGYRAIPMELAGERAVELGKKYVHNDMCFPAQLNIGEALAHIEASGRPDDFALGLAHFECDCRLAQYATVARKALDDAGYPQVPIITTGKDKKGIHPGLKLGISFQYRMLWAILIGDSLDGMARRLRPYEQNSGETDRTHRYWLERIQQGFERGTRAALEEYRSAVTAFNRIPLVEGERKPRVFVIGEILINYHPVSNAHIEEYLEKNGMEVVMPPMIDVFKKDASTVRQSMRRFHVRFPFLEALESIATDNLIDWGINLMEGINRSFRFFETRERYDDLAVHIDGLVDPVFNSGKGWLIPADIIDQSMRGVNSFVIIQPFGCLPNHITGRGIIKSVKKKLPHIQVLSLDFDPDTSLANVENRLQMLIINARELEKRSPGVPSYHDNQQAIPQDI